MRLILKNEYEAFALSLKEERVQGLRFNTLKAGLLEEEGLCAGKFGLKPVPWCREGFTYGEDARPGRHPYHEAGLYYIQEPSAMAAVEAMDVREGEKILDLCASPGGKSTQIAAKLAGGGLLIANEIHPARAKILSQNIERMGIRNAVVLSEDPETLTRYFPAFFDRILVDVPCSGEGMFRKDEGAIDQWSEENIKRCAKRGQDILGSAAAMLRPGGTLLYSTCTFETEEDEGAVEHFLNTHGDFSPVRDVTLTGSDKFSNCHFQGLYPASDMNFAMYRLWPHRLNGEGAFFALLKKSDDGFRYPQKAGKDPTKRFLKDRELKALIRRELGAIFNDNVFCDEDLDHLILTGNDLYLVPEDYPLPYGLSALRCGLKLGSIRKERFEPSHSLALAVRAEDARCVLDLASEGEEIRQYLHGDTLIADEGGKSWVLVCVDGYPVGWGRAVNGVIKNHYPKGLRLF